MSVLTTESIEVPAKQSTRGYRVAEEYYTLAHWIRSLRTSSPGARTIGVTGCSMGAGVSTVAAKLAVAAAEAGDQPVLLLDFSTARPKLASHLLLSGDLGLQSALMQAAPPSECVRTTPIDNLSLLAFNNEDELQSLNMDLGRLHEMIHVLEHDFPFIVVDLPTTDTSFCFTTAGILSGVLLVMESERTHCDAAARAKQRLNQAHANVLGVILNKHQEYVPTWLDSRL